MVPSSATALSCFWEPNSLRAVDAGWGVNRARGFGPARAKTGARRDLFVQIMADLVFAQIYLDTLFGTLQLLTELEIPGFEVAGNNGPVLQVVHREIPMKSGTEGPGMVWYVVAEYIHLPLSSFWELVLLGSSQQCGSGLSNRFKFSQSAIASNQICSFQLSIRLPPT